MLGKARVFGLWERVPFNADDGFWRFATQSRCLVRVSSQPCLRELGLVQSEVTPV